MQSTSSTENSRFAERYLLIERLHTGSCSEVWLATDTRSDIEVALKVLDRSAAEREPTKLAFEREWQIARSLNHPHTVRALSWQDGPRPAYTMQYIDGTDFSDLAGRAFEIWAPPLLVIIDTLIYWHRKGVVHGDLKPTNMLLDRSGAAYLADFGSAIVIEDHDDSKRQDVGSPAYASPERRAGALLCEADDVYSIAAVIAELSDGDPAGEALTGLPVGIRELVGRARRSAAHRPTLSAIRDLLASAGVTRQKADLQALDIVLRRPAASVSKTTVPPTPKPHGAFESPIVKPDTEEDGISLKQVALGLVAVILMGFGFVQLLQWLVGDDSSAEVVITSPLDATVSPTETQASDEREESPPIDPAQRLQDRAAAEESLGKLLTTVQVLEQRAADRWGGAMYADGLEQYRIGDRAYLAADYANAKVQYDAALAQLMPLTDQVNDVFLAAMRDGEAALLDENSAAAVSAFELALAITPSDNVAAKGLARAKALDSVLEKMALGKLAEADSRPSDALALYSEALGIDPDWQPAVDAVESMESVLAGNDFRQNMSKGFEALDNGRFGQARISFEAARALRPNSASPADGLLQVRLAERLEKLNGLMSDAKQQELAEQWPAAKSLYESALSIDDSVDAARDGALRAESRMDLNRRAAEFINQPDRLSELQALRAASTLLTQLEGLSPQGPSLARQINALQSVIKKAAVPRDVFVRSDGLTSVDLLRVERLGAFEEKSLRLRPGVYTAVGKRRGYVDKRVRFRVDTEQPTPTIVVVCDTPI
ncbi:MAG: protein kinase [Woeseiaceae bacterium]